MTKTLNVRTRPYGARGPAPADVPDVDMDVPELRIICEDGTQWRLTPGKGGGLNVRACDGPNGDRIQIHLHLSNDVRLTAGEA